MPRWRQVDISVLLSHPTTEVLVPAPGEEPAAAAVLSGLEDAEDDALTARVRHVQEVLTGYRLGHVDLALEGEPRADYAPGVPMLHRYAAKAAELGVGASTLRRWVSALKRSGPAGLVNERPVRNVVDRVATRWVEMARSVLEGRIKSSRPVRNLVLIEIEERLAKEHGPGTVPLPARTTGYEVLRELAKGTNAFEGSTKGKRSIANAPQGTYGRLRATRPGEYVVLDTNSLDVFAMEPVTCRWVRCELTVAMDLYSRCITGLRLTPVSTKSVDVAGVLFETVRPREVPADGGEPLPYCGGALHCGGGRGQTRRPGRAAAAAYGRGGDDHLRPRQDLPVEPHPERLREAGHLATAGPPEDADRQAGGTLVQDPQPGAAGRAAGLQGLGRPQSRREGRAVGVLLPRRARGDHPRVDHEDLSPSPPPRAVCS